MKQAKIVEKALSDSVPQQYPETIHEVLFLSAVPSLSRRPSLLCYLRHFIYGCNETCLCEVALAGIMRPVLSLSQLQTNTACVPRSCMCKLRLARRYSVWLLFFGTTLGAGHAVLTLGWRQAHPANAMPRGLRARWW